MIHLAFLCLFSGAVGIVLAAMVRRGWRDVLRLAVWISGAMVLTGIVLGWLLYLLTLGA